MPAHRDPKLLRICGWRIVVTLLPCREYQGRNIRSKPLEISGSTRQDSHGRVTLTEQSISLRAWCAHGASGNPDCCAGLTSSRRSTMSNEKTALRTLRPVTTFLDARIEQRGDEALDR
jgi:hypothetical protein